MSDLERIGDHTPRDPDLLRASGAIAVNSNGEAFTDLSRAKEAVIRSERLDSQHPVVRVDLEKILTEQGGSAVAVVIQDFGLPPRVINISGDFADFQDVRGMKRDEEHYRNAPKQLSLEVMSPVREGTYYFDDNQLPTRDARSVKLTRGEAMLWAHDGEPSDQRTGYICDAFWELTAGMRYWGEEDFSSIDPSSLKHGFVPLIGMAYEANILAIYSLDDVHAEVQYQQVRSLADELPADQVSVEQVAEVDAETLVQELLAGKSDAKRMLEEVIAGRSKLAAELKASVDQLTGALTASNRLETLLAINKGKLRDARREAAQLEAKVRKLEQASSGSAGGAESLFDMLGGRQATETDPHGYCGRLGLAPEYLFALDPQTAARVVRGVHKGLVMGFHPDRNKAPEAAEAMKQINNAADGVLSRLEQGYWNRR